MPLMTQLIAHFMRSRKNECSARRRMSKTMIFSVFTAMFK